MADWEPEEGEPMTMDLQPVIDVDHPPVPFDVELDGSGGSWATP